MISDLSKYSGIGSSQQNVDSTNKTDVPKKDPKDRTTLSEEDFMKLFIKELQYQDPMKPMDSAQMATQVAQFNMVDLMSKSNKTIKSLATSDSSRTRLDAVSLLGKYVKYKGDKVLVDDKGAKEFDFDLDAPATNCTCVITDSQGHIVRDINMGSLSSGDHALKWDGTDDSGRKLPNGTYAIHITAKDAKGKQVKVTSWTTGLVSSLEYPKTSDAMPELVLNGGGAKIGLKDVTKVTEQ